MHPSTHDSFAETRRSLTRRVALLFLIPSFGALAALAIFAVLLRETAAADLLVDRAGRLRLQSEQLVHAFDRSLHTHVSYPVIDLSEVTRDFDLELQMLRDGGTVRGQHFPPAPEEMTDALDDFQEVWNEHRRQIGFLLAPQSGVKARDAAHEYLDRHVLDLLLAADGAIDASRSYRQGLIRRMLVLLAVVVALDLAVFGAALTVLRRYDRAREQVESAQRTLAQSEEMLRELTENIREVFFVRDIALNRIVYVSPAFEQLWGVSREALYADRLLFMQPVHPDDRMRVLEALRVQDAGGPMFNEEYRLLTPSGELRWMWARTFPVRDVHGKVYRTAGLVEDVTERKTGLRLLHDQIARNEAILRTTRDGFFVLDEETRILEANDALCRMLGWSRRQILLERITGLEPPDEKVSGEEDPGGKYRRLFHEKESDLFETRFRHCDGRVIDVEISLSRAALGGEKMVFAFVRDIGPRRRAEAERLQHEQNQRDTLVREVHHRIKNNLQGVVGLLRQQAGVRPELALLLESAITQVNAVAVVHGLQGRADGGELRLAEVAEAVARAVAGLTGVTVTADMNEPSARSMVLLPEESVPVALILNELVTNAVKHRHPEENEAVRVEVGQEKGVAWLRVAGRGRPLPAAFDFNAGCGLGTGLTLARALLPPKHASLTFETVAGKTVAELRLRPPVVALPALPHNPSVAEPREAARFPARSRHEK